MTFKSLRVSTFGLAGVIGMAAAAGPAVADDLTLQTFIAVPADSANMQPGHAFSSFDISFADSVTGNIFIADRSNAGVDIFSGSSLAFLGRATSSPLPFSAGPFTGQQATTSVSGPDGVLTVTSGGVTTLYAGDGNSTLRVYNATNPAQPTLALAPISTGGTTRVDEMAFSPATGQILAANNAENPAFANLFSTNNGRPPVTLTGAPPPGNQITVPANLGGIFPPTPPGVSGGMEQPAWNPTTGTFFVSIPQLSGGTTGMIVNPNNPGGVAEISTAGKVLRTIDFGTLPAGAISSGGCSPTGLAVGGSTMLVGCGNVGTQAVLLNKDGSFNKTIPGLGGTDEIWFDPTTKKYYVTGNNGSNSTRFFDVVNEDGTIAQTVNLPTTTSAHSITVDPLNGNVFVPLAGTDTVNGVPGVNPCPTSIGCIAVFSQSTPVPAPVVGAGLPGLIVAAGGLLALARRRRQRTV
jgi:hypothetical protein